MSWSSHPDAKDEVRDAAVYCADHASSLVAEAFLADYERVRDLLVENQQRGPHVEEGLRLYHFDRFPYTAVYEDDARNGPQIKSLLSRNGAANRGTANAAGGGAAGGGGGLICFGSKASRYSLRGGLLRPIRRIVRGAGWVPRRFAAERCSTRAKQRA